MSAYDVFAIIVLITLALSAIALVLIVGALPGYVARRRKHPYAQAVAIAGWVALVFPPLWPLALVWAYVDLPRAQLQPDLDELRQRLSAVEARMQIREAAE